MVKENNIFLMEILIMVNTLMACLKVMVFTIGMMEVNIKVILNRA
jgi:hypothetical protein